MDEVTLISGSTGEINTFSPLERGIAELQTLHELLLSGNVDTRILADFRDALNRVRNTAWAAQQYVTREEIGQDSSSVLSFLAGERIRAAYQLCQGISEDMKRSEIDFKAGSLVQLYEMTKTLSAQLRDVIDELGR